MLLGCLQPGLEHVLHLLAERRRCARKVKPVLVCADRLPVKVGKRGLAYRAMRPVIDHLGGALRSPGLKVEEAKALPATGHILGVQSKAAQVVEACLANLIVGHLGYHIAFHAEIHE